MFALWKGDGKKVKLPFFFFSEPVFVSGNRILGLVGPVDTGAFS